MKLFSNGQFDVTRKVYVFDETKGRFVPTAEEVNSTDLKNLPEGQTFLEYSSRGPNKHRYRPNNKFFNLTIYRNGKIIQETKNVTLDEDGPNEDYEKILILSNKYD